MKETLTCPKCGLEETVKPSRRPKLTLCWFCMNKGIESVMEAKDDHKERRSRPR